MLTGAALIALATAAEAEHPAGEPDDPLFQHVTGCPLDPACGGPSGQWNLFSYTPTFQDQGHASGISADLAWGVTTGSPDVTIAILDSGVNYDHEDLENKIWLNRGELPVPDGAACAAPVGDPHDCNDDGVFNVADYEGDSRVDSDFNGIAGVQRSDLRVFADDVDDDSNGYIDDLSGWDSDDDDGDEYPHNLDGHGTGRAGIAAAETNNTLGVAGVCPDCSLMGVRVDDSFVASSEGVGKGAIFAVDNGAKVINMALGATTASSLSRGAFDYATTKNVLAVNATANEFSTHHNFQTVFDDVMGIGGVTYDNGEITTTWMQKASFSNYGAHIDVVTPTEVQTTSRTGYGSSGGTSSSVPHAAGVAGLIFSRAAELIDEETLDPSGLGLPEISSQEVRQIINRTAEDITAAHLTSYPVSDGWDKWTGYGRVHAKAAVDLVGDGTIPPEADINSPDWYTNVTGVVTTTFYANARWTDAFDYELEWGAGVEPGSWTSLATGDGEASDPSLSSASMADNFEVPWDTSGLADGLYTLRLKVTDDLDNYGEDRMAVWVRHDDPQDLPGFPLFQGQSLESLSVTLYDLDGDGTLEIIIAGGNGEVHALNNDGSTLAGFPVQTDPPPNLPLAASDAFDGDPSNGEIAPSGASVIGGTLVGDVDRDGYPEIFTVGGGSLYCWMHDGTVCDGFPVQSDPDTVTDPITGEPVVQTNPQPLGITPALGDLDGDGMLEIVLGSLDQKLYVFNHDGTRMAPFPIELFDASSTAGVSAVRPEPIISGPAVADVDGDGALEIVVGTNENYDSPDYFGQGGSGRAYLIEADGSIAPGWPIKPASISPNSVPLVADGVGTSPALADIDGDGNYEIAITVFFGDATIYDHTGSTVRTLAGTFGATGPGGDDDETTPEGGLPRTADSPSHYYVAQGAFADIDADGDLDYLTGSVGNGIAAIAAGSGPRAVFDHLLSAWDATTGAVKPAFPRVMEDWQFFNGPAVADIDGDGSVDIVESSGGFFVHAFNSLGAEPAEWPKTTGHWQTSTPSIGDLDGDGTLEVVQTTRLGGIFVWDMEGNTCQPDEWRKYSHDEWNTGAYGADTRPPSRIGDLSLDDDSGELTLSWTAPGDDWACGTAHSYRSATPTPPSPRTTSTTPPSSKAPPPPPRRGATKPSSSTGLPASPPTSPPEPGTPTPHPAPRPRRTLR